MEVKRKTNTGGSVSFLLKMRKLRHGEVKRCPTGKNETRMQTQAR